MSRILVVDDSPVVLAAVVRCLRDQGHAVTSTNCGEDAICLLAGKPPPDLVVLDIRMPGLDGLAVLRSLGATAPPVIVITGAAPDEEEFESALPTRVLRKPFGQTELLECVASVLKPGPPVATESS